MATTAAPTQSPVTPVATSEPEPVYEVEVILFVGPIIAIFLLVLALVVYAISE